MRVIKARHDLHNSIGHVLGFSEMLLEQAEEQGQDDLSLELQRLVQSAQEITAHINEDLLASKIEAGLSNLDGLERLLCLWAAEVIESVEILTRAISARPDENFETDLVRIAGAANRTRDLAKTSLKNLATPVAGETVLLQRAITPLLDLLPDRSSTTTFSNVRKQGSILVVDDLAENRELLSRRLARLGYSVRVVESGRQALDGIAIQPPELILLDILMPELDGFEVLRQLKANALTQHIPVIMLSSSDQAETAVRCIELGADDFLPKPFNPTLLVARIESSLAKKRLRDQETDFLKYLQNERELSDRLLLNILPQPVAERLK